VCASNRESCYSLCISSVPRGISEFYVTTCNRFSNEEFDIEVAKNELLRTAQKVYKDSMKWMSRRMLYKGMPVHGWEVNVINYTCPCRLFMKYGCCVHLVLALEHKKMPMPGEPVVTMLQNRLLM
jgi:hypothetical protein